MENRELTATFTDEAKQEVNRTLLSMGVLEVSDLARDEPALQKLLVHISEIFSAELPELTGELDQDLMRVSRDVNLSRLFRNRGIMLFYRVLNELSEDNVPLYQYFNDPYTESPFRNRTQFIGWFSKDAHISRDLLFRNIAAIDRALQLGVTLEDAYRYLNKYAHAFRETLKNVLDWDEETGRILEGINPDIAMNIASRVDPENSEHIHDLAQRVKDGKGNPDELLEEMKPLVGKLLDEVTNHSSAKDALDWIKHDILTKPEIRYRWMSEGDYIEVTLIQKGVDENGNEYESGKVSVPLIIDSPSVPTAILQDIIKRLPITNRNTIDLW